MSVTTTPEEMVQDGLAEIPEALRFLGIKRAKLYALMDAGELPFVTIGRRRLIPRRALVELAVRNLRGGRPVSGR